MTNCIGIQEYCDVPNCKQNHLPVSEVKTQTYHVCNEECKQDQKHREILESLNDKAPESVIEHFAPHGVYINKSTDKTLKLTSKDSPKSIFYYDKEQNTLYTAENIYLNENNNNSIFKTCMYGLAGIGILAAVLFILPKSRNFILKHFPKLQSNLNKFTKTVKTSAKSLYSKVKFHDLVSKTKVKFNNISGKMSSLIKSCKTNLAEKFKFLHFQNPAQTAKTAAPAAKAVTTAANAPITAPAITATTAKIAPASVPAAKVVTPAVNAPAKLSTSEKIIAGIEPISNKNGLFPALLA